MLIQVLCTSRGSSQKFFLSLGHGWSNLKNEGVWTGTYLYPVQMSAFGELFMDSNDVAKRRPNMRQL